MLIFIMSVAWDKNLRCLLYVYCVKCSFFISNKCKKISKEIPEECVGFTPSFKQAVTFSSSVSNVSWGSGGWTDRETCSYCLLCCVNVIRSSKLSLDVWCSCCTTGLNWNPSHCDSCSSGLTLVTGGRTQTEEVWLSQLIWMKSHINSKRGSVDIQTDELLSSPICSTWQCLWCCVWLKKTDSFLSAN